MTGASARHEGTWPGCATLTRMLGGSPDGTATYMASWLLVEQPGPWRADALESAFAGAFPADRLDRARAAGLRPLLIRRPGRHQRAEGARRAVFVGGGRPGHRWLERFEITDLAELAALDLDAVAAGRSGHGEPVDGPLFLVCTHGSKDLCCAVLGRPVAAALAENHPGRSWEVSHVGGDRWAGNLLVVPDGFLHGQLTPDDAALVAKAALAGQVHPDHLRGRTSTGSRWEQCAEIAVRRHTGLREVDAVLALGEPVVAAGDARTVLVRAGAARYAVTVRQRTTERPGAGRCAPGTAYSEYVAEGVRHTDCDFGR
jgi:hypothetical protein